MPSGDIGRPDYFPDISPLTMLDAPFSPCHNWRQRVCCWGCASLATVRHSNLSRPIGRWPLSRCRVCCANRCGSCWELQASSCPDVARRRARRRRQMLRAPRVLRAWRPVWRRPVWRRKVRRECRRWAPVLRCRVHRWDRARRCRVAPDILRPMEQCPWAARRLCQARLATPCREALRRCQAPQVIPCRADRQVIRPLMERCQWAESLPCRAHLVIRCQAHLAPLRCPALLVIRCRALQAPLRCRALQATTRCPALLVIPCQAALHRCRALQEQLRCQARLAMTRC